MKNFAHPSACFWAGTHIEG